MVNNSTNINKMYNHLLPQIIEHKKRPRHMTLDIQVLAWNRHKTVAELNLLMGSQPIHIFTFVFVDWLTCKILITTLYKSNK